MQRTVFDMASGETTVVDLTPEEITALPAPTVADYTRAVQALLDARARELNYDDIVSACSYAAAPNVFQAESIAFLEWRAAVWQTCYGVLGAVEQQLRPVPTIDELLGELPVLVLP